MCTLFVDSRLGCRKGSVSGLLAQGARVTAYRGTYPFKG